MGISGAISAWSVRGSAKGSFWAQWTYILKHRIRKTARKQQARDTKKHDDRSGGEAGEGGHGTGRAVSARRPPLCTGSAQAAVTLPQYRPLVAALAVEGLTHLVVLLVLSRRLQLQPGPDLLFPVQKQNLLFQLLVAACVVGRRRTVKCSHEDHQVLVDQIPVEPPLLETARWHRRHGWNQQLV